MVRGFVVVVLALAVVSLAVYGLSKISTGMSANANDNSLKMSELQKEDLLYLLGGQETQAKFVARESGGFPKECEVKCGGLSGAILFSKAS